MHLVASTDMKMAAVFENARFVWRLRSVFPRKGFVGNVILRLVSPKLNLNNRLIASRVYVLWTYLRRVRHCKVSPPLLALGWWGSATPAPTPPLREISEEELLLRKADQLYDSNETEELYTLLIKHKDAKSAEILWRLARAVRVLAEKSADAEKKKQLTYESLGYAEQALKLDDKNFACHKWYAITLSNVGDFEGAKIKLQNSYVLKEHFEKAIELNPGDPTCRHLLGMWCFTFADMPWYQRKIASAVFSTPPSSSYDEAMAHFQMAEQLEPSFFSKNHLMMGKTFLRQNKKEDAKAWLLKVVNRPCKTVDDEQAKKEAAELLKKHF